MKRKLRSLMALWLAANCCAPARLFAQPPGNPPPTATQQQQPPADPSGAPGDSRLQTQRDFGNVGVEPLNELRSLLLEGPREQVDALRAVIEEIDRLSLGTEPDIKVVRLSHADAENLSKLLVRIYESRDQARVGTPLTGGKVGFVPMSQPNAIVVIAPRDNADDAVKFVEDLDQESARSGTQFKIFNLKQAPAITVQQKLIQFFTQRQDAAGNRIRVEVVADERTNSVLVYANPNDLAQAELLIKQLDGNASNAVSDLRIFPLRNAVASDLAVLLQQAIVTRGLAASGQGIGGQGQQPGQGGIGQQPGGQFQGLNLGGGQNRNANNGVLKSSKLRFLSTDKDGKPIESGILEDITVTADDRSNSLIVTAPTASMGLVAELIEQLDLLPNPGAELKVFMLRNSDAASMIETLQAIFQPAQAQAGGQGGNNIQQVAFTVGDQAVGLSRVGLNFATDVRTNSVIVSGTKGDLLAVEAMILKLDSSNAHERKTLVYKLRNLTADEAANAISAFLSSQSALAEGQEGRISFAEQISREVTVVSEPISNSLLISSTPRFFEEILRIVEEIDMRPPQVVIQVLIAEVALNDDEELGLEVGTQSSVLYDRSLAVRNSGAAENSLTPGFNFNTTSPLQSPQGAPASEVGLQGLTNFALNRANSTLGYGGLIFTASSDNVSILLRALKRQRRLDVLSRPQIMTLDNQQAFIQIGQQVPTVTASQTTVQGSVVNSVEFRDVGIILQVTPRISPDGVVVMRVDPTVSSLDPSGGIPISSGGNNAAVLAPIINTTRAQTTVSAQDSQTVVIGGLISKSKTAEERKLPIIGDWPVVGWAFKYQSSVSFKRELLIILTPHVVYSECDAERIKQMEAKRIDWILGDVEKVHGDIGLPKEEEVTQEMIVEPSTPAQNYSTPDYQTPVSPSAPPMANPMTPDSQMDPTLVPVNPSEPSYKDVQPGGAQPNPTPPPAATEPNQPPANKIPAASPSPPEEDVKPRTPDQPQSTSTVIESNTRANVTSLPPRNETTTTPSTAVKERSNVVVLKKVGEIPFDGAVVSPNVRPQPIKTSRDLKEPSLNANVRVSTDKRADDKSTTVVATTPGGVKSSAMVVTPQSESAEVKPIDVTPASTEVTPATIVVNPPPTAPATNVKPSTEPPTVVNTIPLAVPKLESGEIKTASGKRMQQAEPTNTTAESSIKDPKAISSHESSRGENETKDKTEPGTQKKKLRWFPEYRSNKDGEKSKASKG
ncbi:MAG: secretin N-terminal domain-containing protein [Planctomycetota bacterium]